MMDALVDLTETGSTLRRNGLKIVDTILTSTTRLIANKESWADPMKRAAIHQHAATGSRGRLCGPAIDPGKRVEHLKEEDESRHEPFP